MYKAVRHAEGAKTLSQKARGRTETPAMKKAAKYERGKKNKTRS